MRPDGRIPAAGVVTGPGLAAGRGPRAAAPREKDSGDRAAASREKPFAPAGANPGGPRRPVVSATTT
ncbi:hypothetical protein GA0115240_132410 [Streptomyces sp. DvalAA-14]|uniref:hypothetical protein n=1 Tax=unclassified Streptomyces TaxID=2593676 RepID=UPI00081B277E|nr:MULTISPECIES: hypothetical protein [unclassified Streptomyces]SCD94970.1 hypothetical protein GA0115240_132410 [Streptomyces sp. DvalAA-14]